MKRFIVKVLPYAAGFVAGITVTSCTVVGAKVGAKVRAIVKGGAA